MKRLYHIVRISLLKNGFQRAKYLKQKNIFASIGKNCFWQPRNVPPEAKLIKLHDNVVIASEVLFVNHDAIHYMLKNINGWGNLNLGAIEVGSNVFIGSRSIILPDTKIEDNVIIGAGSLVRGKVAGGGIYAGVPIKRIGEFDDLVAKRKAMPVDKRRKVERFDDVWRVFNNEWERS